MEAFGKQTLLKRKGRGELSPRPEKHIHELVAIVIVVIPIAFGMPAVPVFVPPTVPLIPAMLPRFVQFVPSVVCLSAVPAMMLDCFEFFLETSSLSCKWSCFLHPPNFAPTGMG